MKVKTALSFGRKRKIKIGGPTDFRHEQTGGGHSLRTPGTGLLTVAPGMAVLGGGADGAGVVVRRGPESAGSHHRLTADLAGETRTTGAGHGERTREGGLGHQDAEGTAVSDDDDSEWEDQEATRLFWSWEESQKRRH